MTHLFYFLSFLPLLNLLTSIVNPKKQHDLSMKLKNAKDKELTELEEFHRRLYAFAFLWFFIGVFSSQWLLFLLLFISSMIPKPFVIVRWVLSLLSAILIIFILVNKYHLHIDILSLIK